MADRFNGAGEDFGDLEDDGDDYNVSLDGNPMPEGEDEDADGKDNTGGKDNTDDEDMFDEPVSADNDAYDPNALLQTAEAGGDYANDEFEPSMQPGTSPKDTPDNTPEDDAANANQQQVQDEQIDFTNTDQDSYAEQPYQDQRPPQQPQQPMPTQQWVPTDGYMQPMQGQQYPQQPAPPQWMQQQYQQYQQYPQQGGYQQMGPVQDDGQYQQEQVQPPAQPQASEPEPAPAAAPYQQQDESAVESMQENPVQVQQPQEAVEEEPVSDQVDSMQYDDAEPQEETIEDEQPAEEPTDDDVPSVTTEIPDSEMIAKIISLADNIRNDLDNDERSALRKILDIKEPDYGENNDQGKEDIIDSAKMVFNSLRVRKSILDAFDDLLSAQDDNDSDRAFFLIRQGDQDLRHIIEICRKFVNNDQKPDSSHLHVSLAEIAAHCISELSDDDVRLLQSARKTLELSREVIHG